MCYQCGYCGYNKIARSSSSDGQVRIRCSCGGTRQDGVNRMHAHWIHKPIDPAVIASQTYTKRTDSNPAGAKLAKVQRSPARPGKATSPPPFCSVTSSSSLRPFDQGHVEPPYFESHDKACSTIPLLGNPEEIGMVKVEPPDFLTQVHQEPQLFTLMDRSEEVGIEYAPDLMHPVWSPSTGGALDTQFSVAEDPLTSLQQNHLHQDNCLVDYDHPQS